MGIKVPEIVRIESKDTVQKLAKLKYGNKGTFEKLEDFREKYEYKQQKDILVPSHDTVRGYYYGKRLIQEQFLPFMAIALGASEDVLRKENIEERASQKEEHQKKKTRRKKIVEHYEHNISDVITNRHAAIIRTYTILKTYGLSILLTLNDDLKNQYNQKGRYIGNVKNNLINLAKYDDEEQLNDFGAIYINDFFRIFDSEKLKATFLIGSEEITLTLKTVSVFGSLNQKPIQIRLTGTEILRFVSDIDSEIQHRLSFWSISSHPDDQINYMKIEQKYALSSLDK